MKALQYLNKYLYQYRVKLAVGILITVIARVFSLFAPRLIGNSITAAEEFLNDPNGDLAALKATLLLNIAIIVGTALLSGFFTFLMRQTIINVSRYIEYDLKNEVFEQYLRLSQVFYKNNRTGDLMNRISEDVGKVRMYVGPAIMYSINTVALFVIVISYMISIAPQLTLYTIIPLPLLSFLIYKLSRIINIRSTKVQETLSKLSSFTQESFSGISVLKSYNLQAQNSGDFDTLAQESQDKNMALVRVQAWFFPLMILLIGISNLLVIFIGGKQYIADEITIGVLAEFIIYVNMLTWPVAVVGWITSIVQQAEASQERINAFLKERPQIVDGPGVTSNTPAPLVFDKVSLYYPETEIMALQGLDLVVEKGTTLGIVGAVGSGKSTLLDLICRLYDPSEGSIRLGDHPLKEFKIEELRSRIGYVPQNPFLFSQTILENIQFGNANASFEDIKKAAENAAVADNIEAFKNKYKTVLGERGVTLSGGQKQRVSLARALVKDPEILLLDDCLSAVDTDTEETILNNLKKLRKNKTTLIVSHRLSSIIEADQIIVLDRGKIIQKGTHQSLVKSPGYYQELFIKQQSEKEN
ncbi:MAG: ABC transporter ATP-binding protein [Flavobacteriia bacterium]|nr:ABC transporter ATP-binding protein [Flavobacteriia bacterium]